MHQQVSSEFIEFGQSPEQEAEEYLTCDEWSSDSESNSLNTDATSEEYAIDGDEHCIIGGPVRQVTGTACRP